MTPARAGPARVLALGERFRRDDGAGPAVLDRLAGRRDIETRAVTGAAPEVLAAMTGADRVIVVDAVHLGVAPGTVRVLDVDGARRARPALSGHGSALADALALGAALGRLPASLVVVGIEAADLGYGEALSPAVAAALDDAAAVVARLANGTSGEEGTR